MRLPNFKQTKWNYPALAFAVPVFSMLMVMLFSGYVPFGNVSMLYSDMYHQYYPFFKAFRHALLSGESLLYSWDVGLGMDYLGLISYYLASPLNLLAVLVPSGWTLEFFSLLVPIKLGFASLFFAIFLKKLFGKDDFSLVLFGSFYGLCAWALGYQWNIMWLDTFALLPLVALGTVSLLRDKKFILYTVTLFLSIAANYYVGFFVCIFVFLLFFCYQLCCCRSVKGFFSDLFRIGVFSVLAIGMTAFLELPALAALQTTQSSVNNFPEGFKLNIADENTWKGLLDAMRQVAGNMAGGVEPTFKEGLPNLYCGIATLLLAVLYLTGREIKLREKFCGVALLLFFCLSFILRQLDYIWHGFHFTNMIPYRFSFLFSFVLLVMAYHAWNRRNSFRLWQVLIAAGCFLLVLFCSDSRTKPVFLVYNLGFLALYLVAGTYGVWRQRLPKDADDEAKQAHREELKQRQHTAKGLLAGIMALEIVLNMVNFAISFSGSSVKNYPKGTKDAAVIMGIMHELEDDTPFYRAEVTHTQTLNDGALNGYNGISTFTSSANVKVTEFMKDLGYSAKNTYNRYCYEEASPVSELFLGLKYLIERDGDKVPHPCYETVYSSGSVVLLKNKAYLPLGFLAENSLAELDFATSNDDFLFQNRLFKAATGLSADVWKMLPDSTLSIEPESVKITTQSGSVCNYNAQSAGKIYYRYTANRTGYLCLQMEMSKRNSFVVLKNGEQLFSESISLPQTFSAAQVTPGDVIEIRVTCKSGEKGKIDINAAIMDEALFWQGYEVLSASTLELTKFRDTLVEGTIDCNRDGLLYTSIPQNGNWSVQVDGEEAEVQLVGNAMVAVKLTEGQHTLRFVYRNRAFTTGLAVSLVCAAILGAMIFLTRYKPGKKGKYQK